MRRKKFLNRVLASALTAAMLVSSVPVTTLAAESGSSEAELFSEGTDSGAEVSLSSETEDFSDEEITSETEENPDTAQPDDAAETPQIPETEAPVNQEPSDEEPAGDAGEDVSDVEDGFTDDADNSGSEDDKLQMDTDQDNAEEVSEIEEQSDSSDEADSLELDTGDAAVAGKTGTTSEFEYETYGSYVRITKYIGSSQSVSIPSSIEGYTVTGIGWLAFAYKDITDITIPDTVTSISDYAFKGCKKLSSITLPESMEHLGTGFIAGTSISSIVIPKNVIYCGDNRGGAFYETDTIKSVTFEDGMKSIPAYTCYAGICGSVTSVNIPDTVTQIETGAFKNCQLLNSIKLPDNIEIIGVSAFSGSGLTEIYIPKTIISISDEAFKKCTSLKNVMMNYNDAIIESPIEGTCTYICYEIGKSAFEGDTSLSFVHLSENVLKIGACAFMECSSLTSLTIPERVREIGSGFIAGTAISSITIPKNVTNTGSALGYSKELKSVIFEEGIKKIPDYICYYGYSVSDVSIPDTVTEIGKSAFGNCNLLESVRLPDSITEIGDRAFEESALISINIPNAITKIGEWAFANCKSLQTVTMNRNDTVKRTDSKCVIGESAFQWDTSLKSVDLPENLTEISRHAFANCSSLANITIPDKVTEIGEYAFSSCISLETLELPDSVKKIGSSAYISCKNLSSVKIGTKERKDEPKVSKLSVRQAANNSADLKLEWKMTSEESYITFGDAVFSGCTALKTVSFSLNTVKNIYYNVFSYCNSITDVYYLGAEEDWKEESINSINKAIPSASRHFTKNSEEKETGYELACALKKNAVYSPKNTEFIAVPEEATLTMNYTPKESAKTYFLRIRKCTKYKESGDIVYGEWTPVSVIYMTGIVTEKDVQDGVKKFVDAMENFTKKLNLASKADLKNYADTKIEAQILRETDEKRGSKRMVTFTGNPSDRVKDCVYEVLAEYMQTSVKFDIGKLDIKSTESLTKYAAQIINAIGENIENNSTSKTIRTDVGTIRLSLTGFSGGFSGSIFVNNELVAGIVSGNKTKVITDYLKNLSDAVNNLMYQTCVSLFKEFANATSLTEYLDDQKASTMESLEADLKKAGYGKLYKTMAAMKEAYNAIEAIKNCTDSADLKELLKNSKTLYEKLRKLNFSDAALTKIVLKDAETELENRRQDLGKLLYAYYTGTDAGQMNSWFGKVWTKIMGNCPVNMVVYDVSGNEIGRVVNGKASYKPEAVFTVEGNTKTAYVDTSALGKIEFTGTGSGTMNYSIQEMNGDEVANQINYYDVPLKEGLTYTQTFAGVTLDKDRSHSNLITKDSEEIKESNTNNSDIEPEYVTVSCTAETGGTVSEGGQVIRGQRTSVEATANEGYTFGGWYNGEELVSTDSTYYFAPSKDVTLTAKFEKQIPVDNNYRAVAAEDSQANMFIVMNKNGSGNLNITGAGTESKASFILKCYPTANGTPEQQNITVNNNGSGIYVYENLAYSKYEKIELCDTAGKLLVTLWKKDLLLKNIADVEITLSGDKFKHTGKEIRPEVTVKDLDKDLDYTIEYKDNINAGTASVIITGIGDYKGTVTKTFLIYEKESDICEHKNKVTSKAAKPATCTEDGYTAEIKCADCGTILEESTVVKATGHKEVTSKAAKAATCTENGYTVETKCSVCGKILTESTEIKATGHKEVTDAAVAATALKTGKTAGSHCSVCGTVIKKQTTISKLPATIKLSATKKTVKETQYFTLTVSKLAKGDSIKSITPSGKSILKVQKIKTNNYKITGVKAGTAKVTVTLRSGKKAICTVKVEKRTLTVNKSKVTLSRGKSTTLTVKGSPAVSTKAKTVKFSSSNSKIATVTSTGKITAKKAGTCKIYVKGNGITKVVTVTVKK